MTDTELTRDAPGLTTDDVADALDVSRKTIYRMIADGRIPAVRRAGVLRVPESFVSAVLQYERDVLA